MGLLVFNHPTIIHKTDPGDKLPDIHAKLHNITYDGADLETARAIIKELDISGEINFISRNRNSFSFPVVKPGLKSQIWVNTLNDSVKISREYEGVLQATAWLHSMPGPHNASVRGNSLYIKIWRVIADAVVYLIMFLTISGIILWFSTGLERMSGTITTAFGILFFIALLFLTF